MADRRQYDKAYDDSKWPGDRQVSVYGFPSPPGLLYAGCFEATGFTANA